MKDQIKRAYEFDFVHDSQKVFRNLLSAMANPGTKTFINDQSAKFQEEYAPLMAIGCTLLDNESSMYIEKNPRLSAQLHNLTLCREKDLKDADYLFLSSEMNYRSIEEILKNVKRGTYEDPQNSATVFILCQELCGSEDASIMGPGVDGILKLKTTPYISTIVRLRQELEMEYPHGAELVFVSAAGELQCVPRLCRMV